MDSHLVSCGKLEIPDALALEHSEIRTALKNAMSEPGQLGAAAKRVAHHFLPHFAKEEQMIFSAFAMLQDLEAGRVGAQDAPVAPMIALFSVQHHAVLSDHSLSDSALMDLLLEARKANSSDMVDLVDRLRNHEKTEDQVMYPTILSYCKSVSDALQINHASEARH